MRREGALSRERIAPGPSGKRFCRGHPRSGRLCLPDSAGAGPGRLPALLGLPEGSPKSPLTLTWVLTLRRHHKRRGKSVFQGEPQGCGEKVR